MPPHCLVLYCTVRDWSLITGVGVEGLQKWGGGGGGKSFSHAEGGHKKFPSFNDDTWRNVTMHGKLVEIMWPIIKLSKVQGNLNIYQNC